MAPHSVTISLYTAHNKRKLLNFVHMRTRAVRVVINTGCYPMQNKQTAASKLAVSHSTMTEHTGTSEGILVWYGQPSEVQLTRGGVVAEPKFLEI